MTMGQEIFVVTILFIKIKTYHASSWLNLAKTDADFFFIWEVVHKKQDSTTMSIAYKLK